jgi:hypothetical protein
VIFCILEGLVMDVELPCMMSMMAICQVLATTARSLSSRMDYVLQMSVLSRSEDECRSIVRIGNVIKIFGM